MASRYTWLSTLSMVSAVLLLFTTGQTANAMDPDSWDLVTADNPGKLSFLKNGTIIRNSTVANFEFVNAIAYNSANRTLYMSGRSGHNVMASCNLDEENLIPRIIPICEKPHVVGGPVMREMAFDPVTNTLIWYDTDTKALSKMNVASEGNCSEVETVLDLRGMSVQGIALDTCNRFIYWAYNSKAPNWKNKVERVRLDGTDRKEIVSDRGWPHMIALAVDNYAGKLYFLGVPPTDNYTIEESNLDGTDTRVLINGTNNLPLRLAVDETAVYWTEHIGQTIWKVYKNGTGKRLEASATGIIEGVIQAPGNVDCEIRAKSDGSSALSGVDPTVVLLPQALAIMRFLYR